jgi:hypothetical protein
MSTNVAVGVSLALRYEHSQLPREAVDRANTGGELLKLSYHDAIGVAQRFCGWRCGQASDAFIRLLIGVDDSHGRP